jgi:hypothetical protein
VGFSGLSDRGCLRATRRPVILGGFDKLPKGILKGFQMIFGSLEIAL